MNGKTKIFFGPPLAALTEDENNTLEISGKINRAAERYLAILAQHASPLSKPEIACIKAISAIGFMSVEEIDELPDDVDMFKGEIDGLDREALFKKLQSASFAEKVAMVEASGC